MKAKLMVMAVAVAFGHSGTGLAALSRDDLKAEESRISAVHKSAKNECQSLKGNARDVCMAEADGARKVAKADLEARDRGTLKAQIEARIARVEAEYDVARERCDYSAGNVKDVCVMDAKAALARGKADARVEREARAANERLADARVAASRETGRADFDAARERCDRYAGDSRDRCVGDVHARFGK